MKNQGVLYNCANCNSTVDTDTTLYLKKEEYFMKRIMSAVLAVCPIVIILLILKSKKK